MTRKIQLAYEQEVERQLKALPKRPSLQIPESYIGGGQSQLRFLGLRVPQLHQALKHGFSFSHRPPTELAEIWDKIWWSSDCYEVMSLAIGWYSLPQQRSQLTTHWPRLKKWAERIDNWAHSDGLSSLYAQALELNPKEVYPVLKSWNGSENPWLRRQSMVSLLYYSSQRKRVLPVSKILSMIRPQLDFNHHYVQKGVGWTLRECGSVYPKETYHFLKSEVKRISPTAFSAAIEKIPTKRREELKRARKSS